MAEIRENIINYLKLKTKLDIAAARIINEKLHIENTAINYGINHNLLRQKVEILERLNDYFEETLLYENAVRSVMSNHKTLSEAETYFKLSSKIITKEINRYNKLYSAGKTKGPYEYDNPLDDKGRVFTFKEELALLDDLRNWIWKCTSPCTCLICAMVQLSSLAYQFAQKKNKSYPSTWDFYQRADKNWLIAFEMAHSCRLAKLYPNCKNVEQFFETCKNKQQPSSLYNESNIFKVPSGTQILRKRKLDKSFNIDKENATTSESNNIESNNAEETASGSFPNYQFENMPAPLNLTNQFNIHKTTNNISQKENFDPSEAYGTF
ncbi:uncharacterized protein LOC126852577 isoform X2 [Cataglyphis hispanica]|uniref:uncharacterized protein LOC126852577 isoform X2 n=1 Tax=Cataglyphis hispanica TaxID=1086592 RepID=UPI00217F9D41|nr:uncharacterized protein LOC126852577 isoform X2 [Cataglyphis hispanica]